MVRLLIRSFELLCKVYVSLVHGELTLTRANISSVLDGLGIRRPESVIQRQLDVIAASLRDPAHMYVRGEGWLVADVLPLMVNKSFDPPLISDALWASLRRTLKSELLSRSPEYAASRQADAPVPPELLVAVPSPELRRSGTADSVVSSFSSSSSSSSRSNATIVGRLQRLHAVGAEQYLNLNHEKLAHMMVARDELVNSLLAALSGTRAELAEYRKSSKRKLDRRDLKIEELVSVESDNDCKWLVQRRGTKALTTFSSLAIAIRRNLGNTSAQAMCTTLMDDVSRQTVCRGELLAGASLNASFRDFHNYSESQMRILANEALDKTSIISVAVHAFMTDATGSNIWRNCKLMSGELLTSYCIDSRAGDHRTLITPGFVSVMESYCDIQEVGDSTFVPSPGFCSFRFVVVIIEFRLLQFNLASPE